MRFWDASAIVPLFIEESMTETLEAVLREDEEMIVWWVTWVECLSAYSRRLREGEFEDVATERSRTALELLSETWIEVRPALRLRSLAGRLLAAHPLRAADALQLAAALRWCDGEPEGREFASLDERLREAAKKEGFSILPEAVAAR